MIAITTSILPEDATFVGSWLVRLVQTFLLINPYYENTCTLHEDARHVHLFAAYESHSERQQSLRLCLV